MTMPSEVGSLYETEQDPEARSQEGLESAPAALPLDHPTEPVGEWPDTVAVQTVESPAVIEIGSQLITVVVWMAMTLNENVPELPRFLESPG